MYRIPELSNNSFTAFAWCDFILSMVLFFFVNKISFPEGEAQKASCAFTRTRTGNKKRQEPQKTAPVAFLFAVSFYGSITLKVFSNLEAYASRRFRTVASPLICTCPAC